MPFIWGDDSKHTNRMASKVPFDYENDLEFSTSLPKMSKLEKFGRNLEPNGIKKPDMVALLASVAFSATIVAGFMNAEKIKEGVEVTVDFPSKIEETLVEGLQSALRQR